MDLAALADRPPIPRFSQRIGLDFERKRMSLYHQTNMRALRRER